MLKKHYSLILHVNPFKVPVIRHFNFFKKIKNLFFLGKLHEVKMILE